MHVHDHHSREQIRTERRDQDPVDTTECHVNSVVRTRYFYSMLLEAPDLGVDQRFHVEAGRRHVAELHGWGTVCGLRVRDNDCDFQVVIDPGVGIDCAGRELRVETPLTVPLEAAVREVLARRKAQVEAGPPGPPSRPPFVPSYREKQPEAAPAAAMPEQRPPRPAEHRRRDHDCEWITLYVGLCYCEREERPVHSLGGPETCCAPGCENSRVRSGVQVYISDRPPPEPDDPLVDQGHALDGCTHGDLRQWLCEKVLSGCVRCPPDPCGTVHHCITLASVEVSENGEVYRPDNCRHRRLLLPTRLVAELAMYAVQEVKKP